ncbi:hypothetical protein D3C76_718290 [compost metagenome]
MHGSSEEKIMTMPSQRTRAQVQTRDFQVEPAQDAMLSAPIRPVVTGRSRPILLKKSLLPDCPHTER